MAEQTIIVMSDSHGERDIVVDIKNRYQGKVDAIFHNGDSELESSDPVWDGIHVVRGNCDYDSGYPERLVVKLGDVIIAQTHGHLYGINFTWDKLDLWAQQERRSRLQDLQHLWNSLFYKSFLPCMIPSSSY